MSQENEVTLLVGLKSGRNLTSDVVMMTPADAEEFISATDEGITSGAGRLQFPINDYATLVPFNAIEYVTFKYEYEEVEVKTDVIDEEEA